MEAFKLADKTPIGAGALFQEMNRRFGVFYYTQDPYDPESGVGTIFSPLAPSELVLFDGWYPAGEPGDMYLTNEGRSTTGKCHKIPFRKPDGTRW